MTLEENVSPDLDIRPEWLRGIHVDRTPAKKQAVEIDNSANTYIYPNRVFNCMYETLRRRLLPERKAIGAVSQKLRLPGTLGFKAAAEASISGDTDGSLGEGTRQEVHIPRRHIMFPSVSLRATAEFEQAVIDALQQSTDYEKFIGLQKVFKVFGHYYPYWIMIGGKFSYESNIAFIGTPDSIISTVLSKDLPWEATGGDINLLCGTPDVDGWIRSTIKCEEFTMALDISPLYDLLDSKTSAEIKRIYAEYYHKLKVPIEQALETDNVTAGALIALSKEKAKVGTAKGIYYGGSLSKEDVVELVNESHINQMIRSVAVTGKPRIECMVRRAIFGSSMETHAFLPTASNGARKESGFEKAAMAHHIECNGGELQESTREITYFVMYVTYGELTFDKKYTQGIDAFKLAVRKALEDGTDGEKHQELQKVFARFGYYYPSAISLGGRMVYQVDRDDLSAKWSIADAVNSIDRLLEKTNFDRTVQIHTIGGSSAVTGCQDWIASVRTNQTRTQFTSMRPTYELLDDDERMEVLRIYDNVKYSVDDLPELPKGIHFDGTEAEERAIEFGRNRTIYKMIMLRNFSHRPAVDHIKRQGKDLKDVERFSSLDIASEDGLPGSNGFVLGSKGAYRERVQIPSVNIRNAKQYEYDLAYITYKELNLYDEFIQPSSEFKRAIDKALQVGHMDADTYHSLQEVFQRFGYYYPSKIQLGGRIIVDNPKQLEYKPSEDRNNEGTDSVNKQIDDSGDTNHETTEKRTDTEASLQNADLASRGAIVKHEQKLTRQVVANTIAKRIATSLNWKVIGGDSIHLLSNSVKDWFSTVEKNQSVIQRGDLKPLYELLDEEQRNKVQQTYENIILSDPYLRYNYLLSMTPYEKIIEKEHSICSTDKKVFTESLFEDLLSQCFKNSEAAVEYCRNACAKSGFSVVEQKATDKIVCLYCSMSAVSGTKDQQNNVHPSFCQWGISLIEEELDQWRFHKFDNEEESIHNHELNAQRQNNPFSTRDTLIELMLVPEPSKLNQSATVTDYVKNGDIVRLKRIGAARGGMFRAVDTFILANECLNIFGQGLSVTEASEVRSHAKDSASDALWKVIRCPLVSNQRESETDEGEKNTQIDEQQQLLEQTIKTDASLSHNRETKGGKSTADNEDYIQNGDIVVFESLVALEGSKRLYLRLNVGNVLSEVSSTTSKPDYKLLRCYVQHANQYEAYKKWNTQGKPFNDPKMYTKFDNNPATHYHAAQDYLYGLAGVPASTSLAIEHLQKASDKQSAEACYLLAKVLWSSMEYKKSMDMYEKAMLLCVPEACRELGSIYHNGFSSSQLVDAYAIPQNSEVAFVYYSVGGILGEARSALKLGEYYEKGKNPKFGIDYDKALRWYEYAGNEYNIAEARSAAGRIRHQLANATKDPLEAFQLRQEAFTDFSNAEAYDPYAKCMVAMYHLNGWAGQQSDSVFGFQTLRSLVESGESMALFGLWKCYAEGLGVQPDAEKASAYRALAVKMNST